jgi:NAD+ kinase
MKIAIYARNLEPENLSLFKALIDDLRRVDSGILLHKSMEPACRELGYGDDALTLFASADDLDKTVDFVISLGGDGTMLDAATLIRDKAIPLLGINFGRLGFLASLGKDDMLKAVDALENRTYHIDQRTLLHIDADVPLFADAPFALNECVLHKQDISSMIKVHTYINGEFLNTYWCDGVIVSTPTGSTAYNLSCNGPIVFPESGSFVITPIAPHHLNVRPIIVPDNNVVSFEVEARSDKFICALDSRREYVDVKAQIAVRKEAFTIGIVRLSENTFLETLRNKLTWGIDKRN